jgi:hypothetical protein
MEEDRLTLAQRVLRVIVVLFILIFGLTFSGCGAYYLTDAEYLDARESHAQVTYWGNTSEIYWGWYDGWWYYYGKPHYYPWYYYYTMCPPSIYSINTHYIIVYNTNRPYRPTIFNNTNPGNNTIITKPNRPNGNINQRPINVNNSNNNIIIKPNNRPNININSNNRPNININSNNRPVNSKPINVKPPRTNKKRNK